MPIEVRLFPCLQDNYGFLVRDAASGRVAAVDTPDGEAVLAAARERRWRIDLILNTHWHPDHTQGNAAVKAATGAQVVAPAEVSRVFPPDRVVAPGETVELGETRFEVLETGGHTLGHVSFHSADARAAFTGDALFALGCGRLFEGTPEQAWAGLQRLAALPPETGVWCAHEYTAANARFALSLDEAPALKRRAQEVFAARERGEPTVPTTIGLEKATNPFLRAPALANRVGKSGAPDHEAFAAVRAAKDAFKG